MEKAVTFSRTTLWAAPFSESGCGGTCPYEKGFVASMPIDPLIAFVGGSVLLGITCTEVFPRQSVPAKCDRELW